MADIPALLHSSLVKHFSVHVQEAPVLLGQMGYWVPSVGYSRLEVIFSVDLVEPNCKFWVSNSGRAKSVKFSNFRFVSEEMGSCMGRDSSSEAVACDTSSSDLYITFYNPNFCLYWATVSKTCFLISLKA